MGTPQLDDEGGQAQRIDPFKMIDQSRHRSVETLRGYVRDAEMFEEHAGAGAALSRARPGLPRVPVLGPHASTPDRSVIGLGAALARVRTGSARPAAAARRLMAFAREAQRSPGIYNAISIIYVFAVLF
jgi:hypothetical protein